jgi:predicted anti-sigma-YlaC factor YlaD
MLTCKQLVQLHTSDYLDGNLTGWQRASVRLHLALCGHCRRFMRQMRLTRKVMAARPLPVDESRTSELVTSLMDASREAGTTLEGKDPPAN